MTMESLILTDHAGWRQITLTRPTVKNALDTATPHALADAVVLAAADLGIRDVQIDGADGNFAARADMSEIDGKTAAEGVADLRKGDWASIRIFAKPASAAVDGFALGGGSDLARMAEFIELGQTTRLGLTETNLGLIPGAGGAQRLLAVTGRARATRMVLTDKVIDAATAFDWGIAACLAPGAALPDAFTLTARLAQRVPLALQPAKAAMVQGDETRRALAHKCAAFEDLLDTADTAESIQAFGDKPKPLFRGQ